jgi:hypothetical protein
MDLVQVFTSLLLTVWSWGTCSTSPCLSFLTRKQEWQGITLTLLLHIIYESSSKITWHIVGTIYTIPTIIIIVFFILHKAKSVKQNKVPRTSLSKTHHLEQLLSQNLLLFSLFQSVRKAIRAPGYTNFHTYLKKNWKHKLSFKVVQIK